MIAALGDSLTRNLTTLLTPQDFWPTRLAGRLGVPARNFGRSGNTTTQMRARLPGTLLGYDVPALGILWGGVNDPGHGITGADTQANLEAMIAQLLAARVERILVLNTQYCNFATGGDTLDTPYAPYAALRPWQAAAVTTFAGSHPVQVVLCDLYTAMRQIVADDPPGSNQVGGYTILPNADTVPPAANGGWSCHVAPANQHLNPLGQEVVAGAVYRTICDQPGWLAALQGG